jgi:hypothetical protein
MRVVFFLIFLVMVCGCASDDVVSKRKPGQQLVCHKGHTRAVTTGDFFVHQDHGDTVGPCPIEK